MSFDYEFWQMMPDRVSIEPWTGQNNKAEPVYGAPVVYPCRVSGKAVSLRRFESSDRTPIFDIWANTGDTFISTLDRITIEGADPRWSEQGRIVIFAVGQYTDDHGVHHTKIQCGFQYHRQGQ